MKTFIAVIAALAIAGAVEAKGGGGRASVSAGARPAASAPKPSTAAKPVTKTEPSKPAATSSSGSSWFPMWFGGSSSSNCDKKTGKNCK